MKNIIFILFIVFAITSVEAKEAATKTETALEEKTIVTVKGMVCSFCAQGIEKKLKTFKEVKAVDVDLDTKKVTLQFNPGQALPDEILQKTIKDAGYEVVSVVKEKK
jgi:copper chaperone CopZ